MTGDGLPPGVAAALAAHGLLPDLDGYDVDALVAAAEALGLVASVEPVTGASPRHAGRYRAVVWRAEAHTWDSVPGSMMGHRSARGRGPTEAAALGAALGKWLRRWGDGA